MKIKLSRKQWEEMGKKAAWMDGDEDNPAQDVNPTKFYNCMMDLSGSTNPSGFALALRDLCVKYNVKVDIIDKTIDV